MAGVYRFEDLRVWQAAKQQCDRVGELITRPEFVRDRKLSDQMNEAAISVMFNISEGFLRRLDSETLQFLRYAISSNGEVKAGYYAADGRKYILAGETTESIELNESIGRMLRRWMSTLDPEPTRRRRSSRWTKDQGRTKNQGPRPQD
jgi:four helix bundle protein